MSFSIIHCLFFKKLRSGGGKSLAWKSVCLHDLQFSVSTQTNFVLKVRRGGANERTTVLQVDRVVMTHDAPPSSGNQYRQFQHSHGPVKEDIDLIHRVGSQFLNQNFR